MPVGRIVITTTSSLAINAQSLTPTIPSFFLLFGAIVYSPKTFGVNLWFYVEYLLLVAYILVQLIPSWLQC